MGMVDLDVGGGAWCDWPDRRISSTNEGQAWGQQRSIVICKAMQAGSDGMLGDAAQPMILGEQADSWIQN